MSRVIADGLSKRVKATTAEAEAGTVDKFPDAAGVKAYVNQFGINAFVGNSSGDADTFQTPGTVVWLNTAAVNKPEGAGLLTTHTAPNSSTLTQTFVRAAPSSKALRHYLRQKDPTTDTWNAWYLVYNQSGILGTVSQSSGVPTGAIIERGSNANGEYVKFADGTLECWKIHLMPYDSPVRLRNTWTFPVPFIAPPVWSGHPVFYNSAGAPDYSFTNMSYIVFSTELNVSDVNAGSDGSAVASAIYRPAGYPDFVTGDYAHAALSATGRWY